MSTSITNGDNSDEEMRDDNLDAASNSEINLSNADINVMRA